MLRDKPEGCCKIRHYQNIYRFILCALSCTALFTAFAIRASMLFSPSGLENVALGKEYIIERVKETDLFMLPAGEEKPSSNLLYQSEIYLIENDEGKTKEENPPPVTHDDGVFPIISLDLSESPAEGEVLLKNTETDYSPDIGGLLHAPYPEALRNGTAEGVGTSKDPLVLIIHTHGTECYTEEGSESYTEQTQFRSSDTSKNMIAVGKVMADTLNGAGITTIHCEIMHDKDSYNESYNNAKQTILYYLEQYPSIKYVFDVHRDAIIRKNGDLIKTVVDINNEKTAQLMAVVGTDYGGADHPNWQDNLNVAIKLQNMLNTRYKNIARPISLRGASFNEQYTPGSILLEVGTCGNTLSEAKRAAAILAVEIADMIKKY